MLTPLALLLAVGVPSFNSGTIAPTVTSRQVQSNVKAFKAKIPSFEVSRTISQASTDKAIATEQVAKLLPTDTIGAVFLNFNPQVWADLRQFVPFASKSLKPLQILGIVLALPEGRNFNKDVLPWLGDRIAIAGLSLQPDTPVSFAIVLPVKDRGALDAFITGLRKTHSRAATAQTYKGVSLLSWGKVKPAKPKEEQEEEEESHLELPFPFSDRGIDLFGVTGGNAAIALMPDNLLIADTPETLKLLIDKQSKTRSLASNPGFQTALRNPLWDKSFATIFGDYRLLAKPMEQFVKQQPESDIEIPGLRQADLIASYRNAARDYKTLEGYAWLQPNGIRSQSIVYFAKRQLFHPGLFGTSATDRIFTQLPTNAYVSISTRNLKQQWQLLLQAAKSEPLFKVIVDGMRGFTSSIFGLDLEKDILPWMDGEYAIVLFKSNSGFFKANGLDFGLALVIKTSNPKAANVALNKFAKFVKSTFTKSGYEDNLKFVQRRIVGRQITSWEIPDTDNKSKSLSLLAYGWADNNTLIISTGSGPMAEFLPNPKTNLAQDAIFKAAIAEMPRPNFGYFYLNGKAIVKLVNDALPSDIKSEIPKPVEQLLSTMQGMVVVYSATPEQIQSDFFLGLSPIKKR
ncbi:MAG: DUF3352 domain-containing protein [Pseudanabaena sp. SU_2_4]|nr:DUF3352 domain-containing protein [Pseudanabaena sp. SU_2_4]